MGTDGKYRRISTEQGLSSAFVLSCAWIAREIFGWEPTAAVWIESKENFRCAGRTSFVGCPIVSGDASGGLWAAFNAHGVSYWFTNSAQDFGVGRGSNAWTVLVDRKQQIWVGTRGEGLFQFQTNHFQPAPGAEILGRKSSPCLKITPGQLWAGTQNGLARWNGRTGKFTRRPTACRKMVRAIAEDAEGNLWIGTESRGLNFFKAGNLFLIKRRETDCPAMIFPVFTWTKTASCGWAPPAMAWPAFTRESGRVIRRTTASASNSIDYIIEDDAGYLWIGSNAGLMRLQKKLLNDFAGGTVSSISCRTYGEADGLPTRECSAGSQPAACRTRDGRLWFPTTKGLVSVNPAELKPNRQPPLVMIESVLVEGREQKTNRLGSAWNQSILVPPGYERLEIHYTALNFSAPNGSAIQISFGRPRDRLD
jgi:hypothetical protein